MYTLNIIVGFLIDPVAVAISGVLFAWTLNLLRAKRIAKWMLIFAVAWAWIWATPMMTRWIGAPLERPYLVDGYVPQIESYPQADAIELHGGGMGIVTNLHARGEMWASADRVWMAARLWKTQARKVKVEGEGEQWRPTLFVTGTGAPDATIGLLEDLGVPTNAIVTADGPRNTEEEAKFIADAMNEVEKRGGQRKARVLVVTSAWHMRRTMLMYEKYAPNVEAIPTPCDFENVVKTAKSFSWSELLPKDEALVMNRIALHEWVGIFGYQYFRK